MDMVRLQKELRMIGETEAQLSGRRNVLLLKVRIRDQIGETVVFDNVMGVGAHTRNTSVKIICVGGALKAPTDHLL